MKEVVSVAGSSLVEGRRRHRVAEGRMCSSGGSSMVVQEASRNRATATRSCDQDLQLICMLSMQANVA